MMRARFPLLAASLFVVALCVPCHAQEKVLRLPDKPTPEEQGLVAALNEKRVDVSFADAQISDAMNYLRDLTGVNIVLVGESIKKRAVTMDIKGVSLGAALNLAAGPEGACSVLGNAVCVGSAGDVDAVMKNDVLLPEDPTPEEAEMIEMLDKKRVTISFEQTPMADVVNFLGTLTEMNAVLVGDKMRKDTRTVNLDNATLRIAARILADVGGRAAVIGNCLCLGEAKDVETVFGKDALIPDNPKDNEIALYGALKDKKMDVSFEETPLPDVTRFLQTLLECNVVADEEIAAKYQASLTIRKGGFDTVLRLICGPDLNYGIAHEVIYISTDERLKKMVGGK
ncbi:MAG: hypothetical protein AB1696_24595 [Planctomycetota bacterium]